MESDEISSIIESLKEEPNEAEQPRDNNKYLLAYADLYYIEHLDEPNIRHELVDGVDNPINEFVFNVIYDDMAAGRENLAFYSFVGMYYIFCFLFKNGFTLKSLRDPSNLGEGANELFQELIQRLQDQIHVFQYFVSVLQNKIQNETDPNQIELFQAQISYLQGDCTTIVTDLIFLLVTRWQDENRAETEGGGEVADIDCLGHGNFIYTFNVGPAGQIRIGQDVVPEFLLGINPLPNPPAVPPGGFPDDPGDDEYGAAGGGKKTVSKRRRQKKRKTKRRNFKNQKKTKRKKKYG